MNILKKIEKFQNKNKKKNLKTYPQKEESSV